MDRLDIEERTELLAKLAEQGFDMVALEQATLAELREQWNLFRSLQEG